MIPGRALIIYLFFFWGSSLLVAVESSFQEKHATTAGPEILPRSGQHLHEGADQASVTTTSTCNSLAPARLTPSGLPSAFDPAAATPHVLNSNLTCREASAVSQFSSKKSYNLGGLIDLALNNNPSTRAAWSQAKAASASVGEARSLYYPWVKASFTGGYDYNYLPLVTGPNVYNRTQATVFFSLEYILLDFGRRDADVARTIATFNALGLTYQRKLQEIIFLCRALSFVPLHFNLTSFSFNFNSKCALRFRLTSF